MAETLFALDGAVLLWIQENLRLNALTPVMLTVTGSGNAGLIWILFSLGLLCFKRTRKAGLAGLVGLLFSLILNNLFLKNVVARIRPYEVVEGLELLVAKAKDFSFPSGHTGSSFACAVAVCLMLREYRLKWGPVLIGYAALMGFSRLYVGIHYPTDVIAGMLTGILCGYFAFCAVVLIEGWRKQK